ncbi:hypothetical protein GWK47_000442 [Chionoecetes opilio]|uniref:Uncharacterized protein n=1 Tax=Chionoecetes opilio TaxID=41210 RepID=A0A8J4YFE3_CHIOP|nr:hypothetical protein GWK47_000442 [Chionoecetes opilio]
MAASLPVVISCSRLSARTCPLHSSGGHWGASVCGGSPTGWGTSPYPNVSFQATPRHSPTLPGAALPSWEPSPVRSPVGLSPHRVHLHSRSAGSNSYHRSRHAGPSPGSITLPAPPFTTSVCAVEPSDHPTRPQEGRRPESPPHELVRRTSIALENGFLEHFWAHCVCHWDARLLPEMSGPLTTSTYGPNTRPRRSPTSQPQSRPLLCEVRRPLDDDV